MVRREDIPTGTIGHPRRDGDADYQPGALVGDYVVERLLQKGGQGAVYAVRHRVLGRAAALKVLHRELAESAEMTERFIREAKVVNQIGHPSIVDVFDIGRLSDGRPFFVMELLEGQALDALLSLGGRFDVTRTIQLTLAICAALQAAHKAGVVHRDLKASNVFLTQLDPPKIKLLDFGIAKLVHPEPGKAAWTQVGQRLGSVMSMAPEQYRGADVDHRTDIYGLGVLMFRMLTAEYPFWSDNTAELERLHLQATPPRPSTLAPVPAGIEGVVMKCLEKSPERRFQSVDELIVAVEQASSDGATGVEHADAIAIHVDVLLDDEAADDDEAQIILADVMDAAERELSSNHYLLHTQTSRQVLAVRVLPTEGTAALKERITAVEFGKKLLAELSQQVADTGVGIAVVVHAAGAEVKLVGETKTVVGGPITDSGLWPKLKTSGFLVTPAAAAGVHPA